MIVSVLNDSLSIIVFGITILPSLSSFILTELFSM